MTNKMLNKMTGIVYERITSRKKLFLTIHMMDLFTLPATFEAAHEW
jgi:hypothetical protein